MKPPVSHNKSIASKRIKKSEFGKFAEIDSKLLMLNISFFNFDKMMKITGKKFPDVLTVYLRYYQCGLLQKTNQPRATLSYMMQGLKMGRDKIRTARRFLKELGMIEDIQIIDDKGRPIKSQFYVKVIYYQGNKNKPDPLKTRCADNKPDPLKTRPPENTEVNAYRNTKVLKGNAYKQERGTRVKRNSPHGYSKPLLLSDPKNPKNKKYRSLALKMMKVIVRDSKWTTIKPNEKDWTTAIRIFCERDSNEIKVGLETIKTIIRYHDDPGRYYLTPIHQPKDLKGPDKLQKIGEFMQRVHEKPRQKNNNNSRVIVESDLDFDNITYTDA